MSQIEPGPYEYTPPFPPPEPAEDEQFSEDAWQQQAFQPGWRPPGPPPIGVRPPHGGRPPVGWLPERWGQYQWPFWGWWGYRLRNAYQDIKHLTSLIQDVVVGMISAGIVAPGPNSPVTGPGGGTTTGIKGPIIGVTDGTDAAPGEVGEFVNFVINGSYSANQGPGTGLNIAAGILPAGDWDVQASVYFGDQATFPSTYPIIQGANLSLRPQPPGFSNNMWTMCYAFDTQADIVAQISSVVTPVVRASLTAPTILSFWVGYNDVESDFSGLNSGPLTLTVTARRMR